MNNEIKKENANKWIKLLLVIGIVSVLIGAIFSMNSKSNKTDLGIKKSAYWISSNSLEPFDLYFLQKENSKSNKVYSPLSIKYALAMLSEGTTGESKEQILNIIGDYNSKKYTDSKNISLANALFIRDVYEESINDNYKNILLQKFNAEVKIDSFKNPDKINSWVRNKTLGLIGNLFAEAPSSDFLLINALAINMEWQDKFLDAIGYAIYDHQNFEWYGENDIVSGTFKDINELVSGMEILASVNNYDIVNVLGEENIRETVKTAFKKYLVEHPRVKISDYLSNEDITGLSDDELMEKYLDNYIKEIDSNYKKEDKNTDFSLYVDENVKAFSKDLKEYNGTTLEYVAIMPINEDLDSYISKVKSQDINNVISNLKQIKSENFKDGVVTKVTGFIPKFKFDYELDLTNDLKQLGITNVFTEGNANLTNITSDELAYINSTKHKANIEFTQDGIKASAATVNGGFGNISFFDYKYDVPVIEIDLTFDKPYMFLLRDKITGEVWFAGTVYNPLLYSLDMTKSPY